MGKRISEQVGATRLGGGTVCGAGQELDVLPGGIEAGILIIVT